MMCSTIQNQPERWLCQLRKTHTNTHTHTEEERGAACGSCNARGPRAGDADRRGAAGGAVVEIVGSGAAHPEQVPPALAPQRHRTRVPD
eukprot:673670-Rhodomonas_salina.2